MNQKPLLIFLVLSVLVPNAYAFNIGSAINAGIDVVTGGVVGAVYNGIMSVKDEVVGYVTNLIFGTDDVVGSDTSQEDTTQEELTSNEQEASKLANGVLFNSTEEANNDILALRKMVESDTVKYTLDESGSTGTVELGLEGPNKIYGYSVFPVKLNVQTFDNPDRPDPTHITRVEISTNGVYWKRVWEGDWKTEGGDFDFKTLLKTPDTYSGNIKNYLDGEVDKGIDEIIHSKVDDFEIKIKVEGYKELWKYVKDDDGDGGHWVHYDDADYAVYATTTNLASAVADGYYDVGGFEGSFPASFTEYREKWTPIAIEAQGASSNILMRVWSNPVHVLNSDVGIDGFLLGNTGYFGLYGSANIVDDYRIVSVRVDESGNYYVAHSVPGKISTFDDIQKIGTTIVYNGDTSSIGSRNYLIVYGTITRDDGMQLPVWVVARMKTTVVSDYRSLTGDTIDEVADILEDNEIGVLEKVELEKHLDSLYNSLDDKISSAELWISKAELIGSDKAKEYATKSKDCYEKAKDALHDIDLSDVDSVRSNLKKAKDLELAGDYYLEASKKEYAGLSDDAESLASNAETLESSYNLGGIILGDDGLIGTLDSYVSQVPGGWITIIGSVLLIIVLSSGKVKYRRGY